MRSLLNMCRVVEGFSSGCQRSLTVSSEPPSSITSPKRTNSYCRPPVCGSKWIVHRLETAAKMIEVFWRPMGKIWAYCAHRASRWISLGRSIRTQPCVGSARRRLRSDMGWLRTDLRQCAMKTGPKLGQKNRTLQEPAPEKFKQFTCSQVLKKPKGVLYLVLYRTFRVKDWSRVGQVCLILIEPIFSRWGQPNQFQVKHRTHTVRRFSVERF